MMKVQSAGSAGTGFRSLVRLAVLSSGLVWAPWASAQTTHVVTNLNDSGTGSLRAAIASAVSGDTITFTNTLAGQTIVLTGGGLSVTDSLTIDASALDGGIIIDGNSNSSIFGVSGGSSVFNRLTITNGQNVEGGGLFVMGSSTLLTLTDCAVSGNRADLGGAAIFGLNNCTLTLNGCTVSDNSAGNTGISAGGGIRFVSGTLTINNSTLSGNSISGAGGGIYNNATMTLRNCTFSGNSSSDGGGIANGVSASATINNCIVADNSAPENSNIRNDGSITVTSSLTSGSPDLAPLGDYGGPTPTMIPLPVPGSAVIDAGDNSVTNTCPADQRGFARLVGTAVDIGAVEYDPATDPVVPIVLYPTNGAIDVSATPELIWTNTSTYAPTATYEIFIDDGAGGVLVSRGTTTNLSFSVTNALAYYTNYQWRVDTTYGTSTLTGSNQMFTTQYAVNIAVESEYGAAYVTPAVSNSFGAPPGTVVKFYAPESIYLDRYMNELGSSDDDDADALAAQAFYRARNDEAPNVNGVEDAYIGKRSFSVEMEQEIKVIWYWDLEYAGSIITGTENVGKLSEGDVVPEGYALGRDWYGSAKTAFSETFESAVYVDVSDGESVQYAATGYVLENAPGLDERSMNFSSGQDFLLEEGAVTNLDATSDFTLEYWARSDVEQNGSLSTVVGIGDSTSVWMWAGFDSTGGALFQTTGKGLSQATDACYDNDWHHWAFAYESSSSNLTTYLDGDAFHAEGADFSVSAALDTIAVGGHYSGSSISNSFEGGVNRLRFWETLRTKTEVVESMGTVRYGAVSGLRLELSGSDYDGAYQVDEAGDVTNVVGFVVSSETTASNAPVVSGHFNFELINYDSLFSSPPSSNRLWSALFPGFEYVDVADYGSSMVNMTLPDGTATFYMDDWARIYWRWDKQFLLTVQVSSTDAGDLNTVGKYPYLSGDVEVDGTTTTTSSSGTGSEMTVFEEWVAEGVRITVGTQYRSDDRSATLAGIAGQLNEFGAITMKAVEDGTYKGMVTRQYTFESIEGPGSLMWQYEPTVFRAELAIGQGLDVSSTDSLNLQLVPDLVDGGELMIDTDGPTASGSNPNQSKIGLGDSWEWDEVGQRLLPVHPGEFELAWQDANDSSKSYAIRFVAGFPTETEEILWDRENEDGSRQGSPPAYVTEVTLPGVEDTFPASPSAHYNALYSSDDQKRPPVELDANSGDRWAFSRLAFSENSAVDDQAATFSASEQGKSVLVFSYRPDSTESANGDLTEEALAVRVVEAAAVDEQSESAISSADRQVMQSGADYGAWFYTSDADRNVFDDTSELSTTIEAWVRLSEQTLTNQLDSIFFELDDGTNSIVIGVIGENDPDRAGAWFMAVDGTLTNIVSGFVADQQWHHMAFDAEGTDLRIWQDGCLLVSASNGAALTPPLWDEVTLCKSTDLLSTGMVAEVDNFRIWEPALDAADLRSAMCSATPSLSSSTALMEILFDSGVTLSGTNGPASLIIPHSGTQTDITVRSPLHSEGRVLVDAREDFFPEVASRILSKLDTAGLSSGYVLNRISNYNPYLYTRSAAVGEWGPLCPVNWSGLFTADDRILQIACYENPYQALPGSDELLHPNVAWPYLVLEYDSVVFPERGEHKDKRITIASRLGSEGVDANGTNQVVFDPAAYANLSIYNQPDATETGYNPNEEHALVAPSIKDQLTGDSSYNLAQDAAFALQTGLNQTNQSGQQGQTYTSEPWVLVQYNSSESGMAEMAAYKVEATRVGSELFPALDPATHLPTDEFGEPVAQPTDPTYDFDYCGFAGDILIPPYPLNQVIGNVTMSQNTGGNIEVDDNGTNIQQRTLWKDKNENAWMVSGAGRFFYQYWYPLSVDFWFDFDGDGVNDESSGTPIAWLPDGAAGATDDFLDDSISPPEPEPVRYSTWWRDTYPILKRGETMTYAGGENLSDNPSDEGLPAIVGWSSGELVYDARTPSMVIKETNMDDYTARVVRPLDRYTVEFEQATFANIATAGETLTPATDRVMVDGSRWYFTELTGSLQKRFYYDALLDTLVFRGRINNLESGDADLTDTPISLYCLEPNVMTADDYKAMLALGNGKNEWDSAVMAIYVEAQNPDGLSVLGETPVTGTGGDPVYWSGLQPAGQAAVAQFGFYTDSGTNLDKSASASTGSFEHLDSLGTGSALAPNPTLLTEGLADPLYVTLVENNHADASGAVALHIIEIGEARLRGGIKVIEAQNVFDEKINLIHTADFGGNTADVFYQWWVRSVDNLDNVGLPPAVPASADDDSEWQIYEQALGLNRIEFSGRPDIMLADKLFYVRYGEEEELGDVTNQVNTITNDFDLAAVTDGSWRLVDINDVADTWDCPAGDQVPYQWAGAFNSPQTQADGSKSYIPQLVMGWVKRILDRVNPYEARYSENFDGDAPATYSSMIQEAGKPYIGAVALNSDRDTLENVGLIELYETVLARAKALTLAIPGSASPDTNQALLLAATRLQVLYNLLASEAYSDAQNSSLPVSDEQGLPIPFESGLSMANPYTFAFQNQVSSLLEEEMALLRGTDFIKAYPSYNRLFWNYLKGLGEAAYNVNYHITDITEDGIINEYDAATLYPQGHGDAWGHYLSAACMHYELLRHNAFDWEARAELYSLLDNVLGADYLDEQTFAATAAARARAGEEIVRGTHRLAYTADPEGQWQGYADDADPARGWGLSEWATRAGQGALFDWAVANAIVPEQADPSGTNGVENLDRIDRLANRNEISGVAAAFASIQTELDQANAGNNPLGLDYGAMMFDLNPLEFVGDATTRKTHFEQVYDRALLACGNALTALAYASRADLQLIRTVDDTRALQIQALKQDYDYRDRLIEIFGSPYAGTIGAGEIYAEGYNGPDTILYMYIDRNTLDELEVNADSRYVTLLSDIDSWSTSWSVLDSELAPDFGAFAIDGMEDIQTLFDEFYLNETFSDIELVSSTVESAESDGVEVLTVEAPVIETADYAFEAEDDWGSRGAPGKIQIKLNEMLLGENALELDIEDYNQYVKDLLIVSKRVSSELELLEAKGQIRSFASDTLVVLDTLKATYSVSAKALSLHADLLFRTFGAVVEYYPESIGMSPDVFSTYRGSARYQGVVSSFTVTYAAHLVRALSLANSIAMSTVERLRDADFERFDDYSEILELLSEFGSRLVKEEAIRQRISRGIQQMEVLSNELESLEAEGLRLMNERAAFNQVLAAKAQRNRYRDMVTRLTRNEALVKYQSAFDNAQRYVWLAAQAYDYETGFSREDPASATALRGTIIRTRQMGLWVGGEPQIGNGGLADILARLNANFTTLKAQLGLSVPQYETGQISLRQELMRIGEGSGSSDLRWKNALLNARVDDLWSVPEVRQMCRPFANPEDGPRPGLILEFSTNIGAGHNVFGRLLSGGDHYYSVANFSTKILSAGVWFQDYDDSTTGSLLSTSPRVYLIPVGTDMMRVSNSDDPEIRSWDIVTQRIPVPFAVNQAVLAADGYIPSVDSLNGSFTDIQRFGDFRAYPTRDGLSSSSDEFTADSRLIGRSVWNTRWMLVIPGVSLNADNDEGLEAFADTVSDIMLEFETYSNTGL